MVTWEQLRERGYTPSAIRHRIRNGRLHPVAPKVYAVGRRDLTRHGEWMAAVLACGPGAALSHHDAAALAGIRRDRRGPIHVSVPYGRRPQWAGVVLHRRRNLKPEHVGKIDRIPVTSPALILIDLTGELTDDALGQAISDADSTGLITVPALRKELERFKGWRGAARLKRILDPHTFRVTRSMLERRFLPLAMQAGLQVPLTGAMVDGYEVDFFWPDLNLIVETDGLTYHRTPASQRTDRLRDQAHAAAGRTFVRFTRDQVFLEPDYVVRTLRAVAAQAA